MIVPPWNLSSAASEFRSADAYLVSIPKCGRTWVRVFFGAYFEVCEQRMGLRIKHTHDLWDHRVKSSWYEQVRGKRLIPRPERRLLPVILMVRDPRDLLVSLFFHLTRRTGEFRGSQAELVRSEVFGIRSIVATWNHWLAEWSGQPRFQLVRYEAARANPSAVFAEMIEGLTGAAPDPKALMVALERSSFENMQRMEALGERAVGVDAVALTPGSVADPDSFKVRAGKVGGYRDQLAEADLRFIEEHLAGLNPALGYR